MKGGRCVSKKPTEGNVWRITLANNNNNDNNNPGQCFLSEIAPSFLYAKTLSKPWWSDVSEVVLENETKVLRDLSGPSPLVNLHPWEKDRRQILFFCNFGENCVSGSLFSSLRTILEVLTHTGEWEVRFIAFLELKTKRCRSNLEDKIRRLIQDLQLLWHILAPLHIVKRWIVDELPLHGVHEKYLGKVNKYPGKVKKYFGKVKYLGKTREGVLDSRN